MGPLHPYSEHLHQTKYRDVGETFEDYVHRYSKALSDTPEEYGRLADAIGNQRLLPAGRQQLAVGREFDTTAFNCLSGDTEIMTEFGFERLSDICGKEISVVSPVSGRLEKAVGKSYGPQDLYEVEVSRTFRGGGESNKFYSTKNHRWVLQNGEVTQNLRPGDILKCGSQYLDSDGEGWVHGFVFGDGCKSQDEDRYTVRLCGEKKQHSHMFDRCADVISVTSIEGDPYYRLRSKVNYKELPRNSTISYVRGFVDGWIAADACTREYYANGGGKKPYQMHSINLEAMEWLYDHIILSRYAPTGKISVHTEPSNYGERKPLYKFHFREQEDHLGFKVLSIKYSRTEEVFCVEEPKYRQITLRNGLRTGQCFVGGAIEDSMSGIMDSLKEAALTLRSGGGCGWNFGALRPSGDLVRGLGVGASSSGPVSFMRMWDAMCGTVHSAGHRRGAMMGVMPIDHPDIVNFIEAKRNDNALSRFNISVAVTKKFMDALKNGDSFDLSFNGRVYDTVQAGELWNLIMDSNWDYAEPGVLFMDRINEENNLWYAEDITATNPCFTGDTMVWTDKGPTSFKDITDKNNGRANVLTQDDNGKFCYKKMKNARITRHYARIMKVKLDNGHSIKCTENHEFFLRDGSKCKAKNLKGKRLSSVYRYKANSRGYMRLSNGHESPLEHHVAVAFKEGRRPNWPHEHCHHVDGVRDNNDPDNLEIISAKKHNSEHISGDNNPSRRFPERINRQGNSGSKNGRYLHSVHDYRLRELRDQGMSYAAIAREVNCSKYTVMKRLGWERPVNHKVIDVIDTDGFEDVYCGTVEDTGRFFIHTGSNDGVLVKNCGEQPLPPYGACLLGSINLTKFLVPNGSGYYLNLDKFTEDCIIANRAFDNVISRTKYPLQQQKLESESKRRMGIGVTGVANALSLMGLRYGTEAYINMQSEVLRCLRDSCYSASVDLAKERGHFALFDERYLEGKFIQRLPTYLRNDIRKHGIRNSHLISIAPTGTISLCADNVSSGIEPPFSLDMERDILMPEGKTTVRLQDYAFAKHGIRSLTAHDISPSDHIRVLCATQQFVDSSVSKTCNVASGTRDEFADLYIQAYEGGAKGCTTFNVNGKRMGMMKAVNDNEVVPESCTYDPETGVRSCE